MHIDKPLFSCFHTYYIENFTCKWCCVRCRLSARCFLPVCTESSTSTTALTRREREKKPERTQKSCYSVAESQQKVYSVERAQRDRQTEAAATTLRESRENAPRMNTQQNALSHSLELHTFLY